MFHSLGKVEVPFATPPGVRPIFVSLDVVSADVPALLGLNVLEKHGLTLERVVNRLMMKEVIEL